MSFPTLTELIPILQIAIGPVILISGVGLLLLSAADRKYGDVSPGTRAAPRTPSASSRPARPYTGSAATDRRPPCRRRARPRARRLGSARVPWIAAANVFVIVFASTAT
jgi:hypothetical protein